MCRMAAYLGPMIRLDQFLLRPPHNLLAQARCPQETCYTKINADGYGLGWYPDDDLPAVYVNTLPMWSDPNLPHLSRSLHADLWLANVRSATDGLAVSFTNTQPFQDGELLFMHNGFIRNFSDAVRPLMHRYLDPEIQAGIQGNTDSEYLFALLRHLLLADEELSIEGAIAALFEVLETWIGDTPAMLNLLVSDGAAVYAARHALSEACPSLYYNTDDDSFPGGQLIASERLTHSEYWSAVPEHSILVFDPEQPPELLAI
ncbi:MAG: class II glutamine amidotransferase [Gammaproteobacteria bacterium]